MSDRPDALGLAYPAWATVDITLPELMQGLEARRGAALAGAGTTDRDASAKTDVVLAIADVLGSVGERFLCHDDPLRAKALDALMDDPGYSSSMAELVLDGIAKEWTAERLRTLVTSEFGLQGATGVDGDVPRGGLWTARSPALHVAAGNVPGVSVTALMRGLLVGSALIVKPGGSDRVLPVLFHRALEEVAPDLAARAAIHYSPHDDRGLSDVAAMAALLVVHGGHEAIRWARHAAGPSTHLIEFPHRVSVLLVTSGEPPPHPSREAKATQEGARAAALAVALFEQRGCVSPHAVYVIEERTGAAEAWAQSLATELERLAVELPSGRRTAAEASAFHQEAGLVEMAAAGEGGTRVWGVGTDWRVVLASDGRFRPSCLGRFVRVYPCGSFDAALGSIAQLVPQLQTVGIVGAIDSGQRVRLLNSGALRVTRVEDVPWPAAWERFDGIEPLRSLVRWWDDDWA